MQFGNFIKLALASAVGVAALQSMTAIAQETRSGENQTTNCGLSRVLLILMC